MQRISLFPLAGMFTPITRDLQGLEWLILVDKVRSSLAVEPH